MKKPRIRRTGVAAKPQKEIAMTAPVANEIAADLDASVLDLDPVKAKETLVDLVTLDHQLRDHGTSLAELLRKLAHTSAGVRVR